MKDFNGSLYQQVLQLASSVTVLPTESVKLFEMEGVRTVQFAQK
jgi:hypothetical protein